MRGCWPGETCKLTHGKIFNSLLVSNLLALHFLEILFNFPKSDLHEKLQGIPQGLTSLTKQAKQDFITDYVSIIVVVIVSINT